MTIRPTPWVEPPHPSVIRLHEDLIQIYRSMKENQRDIDGLFDRVASKIGFVVTTTLPIRAEVADKGKIQTFELDGEALRNTLFETEFKPYLDDRKSKLFANTSAGSYRFYLIWYDALLLKLKWDIYEPAQVLQSLIGTFTQPEQTTAAAVRPEVREPAHWFDPRITLPVEDILTISAIDTVYPDLRLSERIAANRTTVRQLAAYVREPAHFVGPGVREPVHFLQSLVRPEVQEPAHFRDLASILKKFGM